MADPYMVPADFRSGPLSNTTAYPDEMIEQYVAEFEDLAERYRGVAYVPRERTVTFKRACGSVVLPDMKVSEITALTISDAEVDPDDVDIVKGCILDLGYRSGDVVVTYTYGFEAIPAAVLGACRDFVVGMIRYDTSPIAQAGRAFEQAVNGDGAGSAPVVYITPNKVDQPTRIARVNERLNSLDDYRVQAVA